jgi:hypothetical protein
MSGYRLMPVYIPSKYGQSSTSFSVDAVVTKNDFDHSDACYFGSFSCLWISQVFGCFEHFGQEVIKDFLNE